MSLDAAKPAILFPGQGAQTPGMGTWLCAEYPIANELFDEAADVLGYDLKSLCADGPAEKLNETVHSQPALFVVGVAAARVHDDLNPELAKKIVAAAGLSLGEYTAVCYAGGVSFADGLKLVQKRGEAMQACADATDSGMASVLGLDLEKLTSVCEECRSGDEILQPANLLCPGNIAVSGHRSALERLEPAASAAGAMKVVPLSVAGAFHTPIMDGAVEQLTRALEEVELSDTRIPVYSNVDAKPHTSADEIRQLLARQVVNPVRWDDSINAMLGDGVDGFLEAGTGRVLRGTIKRIARKTPTDGFGDQP
ncbi:MAG TPA: [acyl-carrier-protein] S-malonyltransferase [Rhodopirellula baltica]|uniref:Malonyl CoA-acyl carrier protein transacylase n=1 Tax=Rhodopirellula baltica (strain DSM 10527 / NCIMB 13988 / SH1) TaxID=243090 RepID=Q7UYY3_RHOBA|nr:ACP S-malonyltransferase [Rhodopirellula baltica]CAD71507.1 malonyl CoA-acyl carrier protein transacylase [Rhodopirellula baltica SH 1]HBE63432.1 [acyl-carrier-protein] S-malonyltransferase [Rhodopirellula baltica]